MPSQHTALPPSSVESSAEVPHPHQCQDLQHPSDIANSQSALLQIWRLFDEPPLNDATRWFYRCDPGLAVAACTEEQLPRACHPGCARPAPAPCWPGLSCEMPAGLARGTELRLLCAHLQDCC